MCIRDRAMDRALGNPKARKNIIQATFEAAETFARMRNALREPAVAQAAANATWVWYLTPTGQTPVSYTHLRAPETVLGLVFRLLLEKKKEPNAQTQLRRTRVMIPTSPYTVTNDV